MTIVSPAVYEALYEYASPAVACDAVMAVTSNCPSEPTPILATALTSAVPLLYVVVTLLPEVLKVLPILVA